MAATKEVALWSANFTHVYFCQFDVKEKFDALYAMSNLIKNFIFLLLFYTPLNFVLMAVRTGLEPSMTSFTNLANCRRVQTSKIGFAES